MTKYLLVLFVGLIFTTIGCSNNDNNTKNQNNDIPKDMTQIDLGLDMQDDMPGGTILCASNEYVQSNLCVACSGGKTNQAGDDASGADTMCDEDICASLFNIPCAQLQQAYIKASSPDVSDRFGGRVAISGNTIIVGTPSEDSNAKGVGGDESDNSASLSGAVYVFVRNDNVWTQQAYLKASNTEKSDAFGTSVSISGDTIVVGAHKEDSDAKGVNGAQDNALERDSGAAYVFVRSNNTWTQQAYLKSSNTFFNDEFGGSVSISGDTIVVGAAGESSGAKGINGDQDIRSEAGSGAAYVFVRSNDTWTQQAYLKASNTNSLDEFGGSVSISGDTIVVGAVKEASNAKGVDGDQNDNSAAASGAAYVFFRSNDTWAQQAYLKASNTDSVDGFGRGLAISGDTIVVSAINEGSNAKGVNGDQNDNSSEAAGAVYVFVRSNNAWTQQAYLKASNTDTFDGFGVAVAISGDTIVVGSTGEASSAKGVGGDQNDNSSPAAGAVYLFVRSNNAWTQQAYLKASNADTFDEFSGAVAISEDTIVVGSIGEKSNAKGVDGNQNDNSLESSGAMYVFGKSK